MSLEDDEDLDAMMAAISIPDDVDFLNSSMCVGNEDDRQSEGEGNDKNEGQGQGHDNKGKNGRDAVLVGNKSNPFDDSESDHDDDDRSADSSSNPDPEFISSSLQKIKAHSRQKEKYELSPSDVASTNALLSSLPPASPLIPLFRPNNSSPSVGPPVLFRSVVEKHGTASLVKKKNPRELILTPSFLAICKRVKKRNRSNTASEKVEKLQSEGGGEEDDEERNEDITAENSDLELKQLEMTDQMILIDLSVTPMLSLPHHADPSSTSPSSSGPSRTSTPPPSAVPPSRNPFKKIFSSRSNQKKRASIINNLTSPLTAAPSENRDMIKLAGDLVMFKELKEDEDGLIQDAFGIVTPLRTYIFQCPSSGSHSTWLTLLGASITSHLPPNPDPVYAPHLLNRTSLHTACLTSNIPMLHSLMTPQILNKRDASGYTPLHYATLVSSPEAITALLDYKADPNPLCTTSCRTPIFSAVSNHDAPSVRLLISNGASTSLEDINGINLTAALVLGGEGSQSVDAILSLLTSHGLNLNEQNKDTGDTPLHLAVKRSLPLMITQLVSWGAELTVRRVIDGLTPLQLCCSEPFGEGGEGEEGALFDVETMRTLISNGACPNLPVRRDASRRGSVATREEGREVGCLEVLVKGRENERLIEKDGVMVVNEQWCYKVFVGVMELLRSGARLSDELEAILNPGLLDIFKSGRLEWKSKSIPKACLIQYAHHLFSGVKKHQWASDSSTSACMLCEDLFTTTNRRHHCRMCGILACGVCTSKNMVVQSSMKGEPEKGEEIIGGFFKTLTGSDKGPKEERVCDSCFNRTSSKLLSLQTEKADRAKLMARIDREMTNSSNLEISETRSELFKGANPNRRQSSTGNSTAGSNMNEAMKNMGERGEKLEALGEKSSQLKDAAGEFKDMATALKRDQQKKANSWFGV